MYDVVIDGAVIARAGNVEEETIYIMSYDGLADEDIAYLLGIPLESVTRFTEGGATR